MSYFRRRLNKEEELTRVGYGLGFRVVAIYRCLLCFVMFSWVARATVDDVSLILSILEKENNYLMYVGPLLPTNFFANYTLAICFQINRVIIQHAKFLRKKKKIQIKCIQKEKPWPRQIL